jgi:molybdenum cofactor cytidylyltransferase
MPLVSTKTVDRLIDAFTKGKKGIAVPVHDDRRGHPVILDLAKYRDALLALRGDVGIREILEVSPEDILEVKIDSDEVLVDVDTHEDLENLRERLDLPKTVSSYA